MWPASIHAVASVGLNSGHTSQLVVMTRRRIAEIDSGQGHRGRSMSAGGQFPDHVGPDLGAKPQTGDEEDVHTSVLGNRSARTIRGRFVR